MPLIRDYVAEHDRVLDLADRALRAIDAADLDAAADAVVSMRSELASHWLCEEEGIFLVMAGSEAEYADAIEILTREHRELSAFLDRCDVGDPADQDRLRAEVRELATHVGKEEDGLFPASLTALSGPDWNTAMAA